jgi:hypothetical protein
MAETGGGGGRGVSQRGWAQHDFSLAWLEAARYFSEGGHGTTRHRSVQEILCVKCVLLYFPSTEFESTFNEF